MEVLEPVTELKVIPEPQKVNTQLYEHSRVGNSDVARMVDELTDGLYARKDPNLAIEHEKPEHRLILLLKLKGFSNREIARQLHYTDAWISQITRQPWFQLRLIEELSEAQGEIVDNIVRVEATNSIQKIIQLRDSAKQESIQLASAIRILEMHCGKPVQKQEISVSGTQQTLVRVEHINKELEEVEAEEKRLLSAGTHG